MEGEEDTPSEEAVTNEGADVPSEKPDPKSAADAVVDGKPVPELEL